MNKSIFKTVGVVATTALVVGFVGCGNNDNDDGDGGGGSVNRLSVNGAQVYETRWNSNDDLVESKHTGSFTHIEGYPLERFFTDPIVYMTNGKLTIDIGKPSNEILFLCRDWVEEEWGCVVNRGCTFKCSDPTAKFVLFEGFEGNCRLVEREYDGYDDYYSCDYSVVPGCEGIVYADKPLKIEMQAGKESGSLSFRKGWNGFCFDETGRVVITDDFSGSGILKWYLE